MFMLLENFIVCVCVVDQEELERSKAVFVITNIFPFAKWLLDAKHSVSMRLKLLGWESG